MSTRNHWPTARSAVPMAAVVFPLPGPVFTMIKPRRISGITVKLFIVPVRHHLGGVHPGARRFASEPPFHTSLNAELVLFEIRMHLRKGPTLGEVSPHET